MTSLTTFLITVFFSFTNTEVIPEELEIWTNLYSDPQRLPATELINNSSQDISTFSWHSATYWFIYSPADQVVKNLTFQYQYVSNITGDLVSCAWSASKFIGCVGDFSSTDIEFAKLLLVDPNYPDYSYLHSCGPNSATQLNPPSILPYSEGWGDSFIVVNDQKICAYSAANNLELLWIIDQTEPVTQPPTKTLMVSNNGNPYLVILYADRFEVIQINLDPKYINSYNNNGVPFVAMLSYRTSQGLFLIISDSNGLVIKTNLDNSNSQQLGDSRNCKPLGLYLASDINSMDTLILICENLIVWQFSLEGAPQWTLLHGYNKYTNLDPIKFQFSWIVENSKTKPIIIVANPNGAITAYDIEKDTWNLIASQQTWSVTYSNIESMIIANYTQPNDRQKSLFLTIITNHNQLYILNNTRYNFFRTTPSQHDRLYDRYIFGRSFELFVKNSYFQSTSSFVMVMVPSFWRVQNEINQNYIVTAVYISNNEASPIIYRYIIGYITNGHPDCDYESMIAYYDGSISEINISAKSFIRYENSFSFIGNNNGEIYTWSQTLYTRFS